MAAGYYMASQRLTWASNKLHWQKKMEGIPPGNMLEQTWFDDEKLVKSVNAVKGNSGFVYLSHKNMCFLMVIVGTSCI